MTLDFLPMKNAQNAIDNLHGTQRRLSESQALRAIGEAVLSQYEQGLEVSTPALIHALLEEMETRPRTNMLRMRNEAAARLLGWRPPRPS